MKPTTIMGKRAETKNANINFVEIFRERCFLETSLSINSGFASKIKLIPSKAKAIAVCSAIAPLVPSTW